MVSEICCLAVKPNESRFQTNCSCDNSDPMQNGDYQPTRFQAMVEAVNEIAGAKVNGNAETTVGIMSMAGRIEVHLAPCRNLGSIMSVLQKEVESRRSRRG